MSKHRRIYSFIKSMVFTSLRVILASLSLVLCANAAIFTVFDVTPTDDNGEAVPLPSISLSPLGVGNDGATTYDIAQTIEPTQTAHATIVADDTRFHLAADTPFPLQMDCSWAASGATEGTCVAVQGDEQTTITQTMTGRVVPIFTVTVDNTGSGTLTSTSGGSTNTATVDTLSSGTPTSTNGGNTNTATNSPPANQSNAASYHRSAVYFGSFLPVVLGLLFLV